VACRGRGLRILMTPSRRRPRIALIVNFLDSAYQMSLVGEKIPNKELQPGDLVFYKTLKRAFSHVGIYIGNDKFIHSPSPGRAVEIVDMKERYWLNRYQGARRVPQLDQPTAPSTQIPPKEAKNTDLSAILH